MNQIKRDSSHSCFLPLLILSLATFQNLVNGSFIQIKNEPISTIHICRAEPDTLTTTLCRKEKQVRRKPKVPRHPPRYWSDIKSVEQELRSFWTSVNVPMDTHRPPAIPSELLLNYFERHDLRYAIAHNGGRQALASWLGTTVIPGPWKLAVKTYEVQTLLNPNNTAGRALSPTQSPYQRTFSSMNISDRVNHHADNIKAKPHLEQIHDQHHHRKKSKGFWTQERIQSELYQYLEEMKVTLGRPSVWIPRLAELSDYGKDDLKQAIVRKYGPRWNKVFCTLTPYEDWRYFESQLELFLELRKYLVTYHNYTIAKNDESSCDSSQLVFPKLLDIQQKSPRLHDLIMEYGGRKIVANKVGISYASTATSIPTSSSSSSSSSYSNLFQGMSYGNFNLDFAIDLLTFIRNSCMALSCFDSKQDGTSTSIVMPTTQELLRKGKYDLVDKIHRFGGHENVARRLNLSFDQIEAQIHVLATPRISSITVDNK